MAAVLRVVPSARAPKSGDPEDALRNDGRAHLASDIGGARPGFIRRNAGERFARGGNGQNCARAGHEMATIDLRLIRPPERMAHESRLPALLSSKM